MVLTLGVTLKVFRKHHQRENKICSVQCSGNLQVFENTSLCLMSRTVSTISVFQTLNARFTKNESSCQFHEKHWCLLLKNNLCATLYTCFTIYTESSIMFHVLLYEINNYVIVSLIWNTQLGVNMTISNRRRTIEYTARLSASMNNLLIVARRKIVKSHPTLFKNLL